jgi:hypothetical protein
MADDLKGEAPEPEAGDELTLRDRFALAALAALDLDDYASIKDAAEDAYDLADAMLVVRAESSEADL